MRSERCSSRSIRLGEPLAGTGSVVRTWLLLEHQAPWPRDALDSPRLPFGVGPELARRANEHHVRVVLIRRHGRPGPPAADAGPACFVGVTRQAGSWLASLPVRSVEEILDVDFARLSAGPPPGTEPVYDPLFLVCTHGRHDTCCAELGRPVAAALDRRFPAQTWEVSHIGGDRFAGNLVCLPDGDYFGRVDGSHAEEVVDRYTAGRYSLPHLRGRCCYPPPVQAAEVLLRQRLGVDSRGAVEVLGWWRAGAATDVRVRVEGHGEMDVRVEAARAAPARHLTCHAAVVTHPPRYLLAEAPLEAHGGPPPGRR